jgi:hypothetical protein
MEDRAPAARLLVRRAELSEPVLERVVAALAARVDLPLDRLSDAQIASGAVAAATSRHTVDGALCVEFDGEPGEVVLRLGPLPSGAAARVVRDSAVPGLGAIVERLVDRFTVERGADGDETLCLEIGAGAGGASPA